MFLPRLAIRYRAVVLAITALAIAWGTFSFFTAPRRENPEFTVRTAVITTAWPGANAIKVEQRVSERIEEAVAEVEEVETIRSKSRNDFSLVFVELADYVDDVDAVWDDLRAEIDKIRGDLPEGTQPIEVNTNFGDTSAMLLALYQAPPPGKTHIAHPYSPRDLELMAERIEEQLEFDPAVASVNLYGIRDEVIYIETDSGAWSNLALTTTELQRILQQRNIVAEGGAIDTDRARFPIRPTGELNAVDQLHDVVVGRSAGAPVYLDTLGLDVSRQYRQPPHRIYRYGDLERSTNTVIIGFTMKDDENITDLGDRIRRTLPEWENRLLPADVRLTVVSDRPEIVDDKVRTFVNNLWQAVAIVIVVSLALIGLRIGLVMAAAIPIVILTSLGIVRFFGVDIEQITISSLIISLGLLVDNAIEVCDNIKRMLDEGASRREAAIRGAGQIAFPVSIATLTTIMAFLPMLTLPGAQGEFIYSLPVVVSTTLAVSWLVAMTMTTLMAYWALSPTTDAGLDSPVVRLWRWLRGKRKKPSKRQRERTGGGQHQSTVAWVYTRLCGWALRHKFVTVAAAVSMFAASVTLLVLGLIGSQFFPEAERDQFLVDIHMPHGAPLARTDAVARRVEEVIREHATIEREGETVRRFENMATFVGEGAPRFYLSFEPDQPRPGFAQILVNTTDGSLTEDYVYDLQRAFAEGVPEARVIPHKLMLGPPIDAPIGVRVLGDDIERLGSIAARVKDVLRRTEGTWDVHDTWGRRGYRLEVDIDQSQARLAGVTNASVARTLNAFYTGHYLTAYREGDRRVPVYLRLPPEQRQSLEQVDSVYVEGRHGKVPIVSIAELRPTWAVARIDRYRKRRNLEVRSRVQRGLLANAVLNRAMPELDAIDRSLPPGYRLDIGGEMEETVDSRRNMLRAMAISLLLIVLTLVLKYNSLLKPLAIVAMLPLAAIGALLGLFVTGYSMGFMGMLGMLALIGVVLNDDIVLVEFVELAVAEKLDSGEGLVGEGERSYSGLTREAFYDCVKRAGRLRLLPISLTTLTTVGGLLPLALFGGPLWKQLTVVIIGGLLVATALTLVVLPAIYTAFVGYLGVHCVPEKKDTESPIAGVEPGRRPSEGL